MKKFFLSIFLLHSCIVFGMAKEKNKKDDRNFFEIVDECDESLFILAKTNDVASKLKQKKEGEKIKYCFFNVEKPERFVAWHYSSNNKRNNKQVAAAKLWFNSEPSLRAFKLVNSCLGPDLFEKVTVVISPSSPKNTPSDKSCGDKKEAPGQSIVLWKKYLKGKGFKNVYDHSVKPEDHGGIEAVIFLDE